MSSDNYRPVLTKTDFVRRYMAGEFGNHSPTWDSLEDFPFVYGSCGLDGRLFHIRNRNPGAYTWYNLKAEQLSGCWQEACKQYPSHMLYISEMAPTEKTVLQGEVMLCPGGLYLQWTRVARPMREAFKIESKKAVGLAAGMLLKEYMCPNSYDWLMILFERYPDHVVEFSTYSTNWGTLPNFNTVFWEVRFY